MRFGDLKDEIWRHTAGTRAEGWTTQGREEEARMGVCTGVSKATDLHATRLGERLDTAASRRDD